MMKQKRIFLEVIGLALLPLATSAQIYQDVSNSTATIVRDPARQASTEIDAVIHNPAGTAFLDDGWHLSLSGKLSYRSFTLSDNHNDVEETMLDDIPSLQAAYKKGPWTLSLSIGNEGGYGRWTNFKEPMLSRILTNTCNQAFDVYKGMMSGIASNSCSPYDQLVNYVMVSGDLYNYSARIGAAYQINQNLSVYGGLRLNYVTEKTSVGVSRWVEMANSGKKTTRDYFNDVDADFRKTIQDFKEPYEMLVEIGNILGADVSKAQEYIELCNLLTDVLGAYNNGIAATPDYTFLIDKRTNGWGISPVIGLDYKTGKFNFAAKYEFETKIHTQGSCMAYHIPSVLSLGASWQMKDNFKVAVGGSLHHQSSNSIYGRSQTTDISNEDLYFNMGTSVGNQTSFHTASNSLTSGDISASVSFSPIEHLMLSVGYTYAKQSLNYKGSFLQVMPIAENLQADIISGGLRYDISDKVQLDFGISKKSSTGGHYYADYSLYGLREINMSAGININL